MRRKSILFVMLLLPACAVKPGIVTIPRARCADLIPSGWADGVPATPVPDSVPAAITDPLARALAAVKGWAGAYVGESAQREKANGRTLDTISIMRECERQANEARADAPKHR